MPPASFDIAAALRRIVAIFWVQFAPTILLGFALLTAPAMIVHATMGTLPAGDGGTVVSTILVLLGMMFVAAANAGVLITRGRPAAAGPVIGASLAASRPGVIVALVLAAAIMLAMIVQQMTKIAGLPQGLPGLIVFGLLGWLLVSAFVAIPVAIAERRLPLPALQRSFALTAGHRWRIAAFAAILLIGLLPGAMLINGIVFGASATPESAETAIKAMTLASPGLWIGELFWLLACSFLAPAPAVVYLELSGR